MFIRKKIWSKTIPDALVTGFCFIIIPIVYYFELFIVLPEFYTSWGGWYNFHFLMGTFIMFNICSNWLAIILCDTSIKGRIIPANMGSSWRFCSICETVAPPRSWHCNFCNICILKRDHHCMFTSCCVGHFNMRYFMVFVSYLFIATIYASCYNISFILEYVEINSFMDVIKLIFPLATLFVDFSVKQLYVFLVLIIIIACVFTGILLVFHGNLIKCGVVSHERSKKISEYDFGTKLNVIEVFGDRWYLVWISPFIESNLPHDGIHWDVKQSFKAK